MLKKLLPEVLGIAGNLIGRKRKDGTRKLSGVKISNNASNVMLLLIAIDLYQTKGADVFTVAALILGAGAMVFSWYNDRFKKQDK